MLRRVHIPKLGGGHRDRLAVPRLRQPEGVYYSLIGTCLLQGIDPRRYLVEVLGRLDEPPSRLTPHAIREQWQAATRAT